MKRIVLAIVLAFGVPSIAKTSTDLFFCGGLEIGVAALNAVASICSDAVKSNQTTLKITTGTYGIGAGLMALTGAISMFDSRIDYAPGRTNKVVPWVITGVALGVSLISLTGMVTSIISFETAQEKDGFVTMLGTSVGATVANLMVLVGALRWAYYMTVLTVGAPDGV